ncbi:hypothetical protein [Rhodococcus sp. IEGM 1305]|jgi:cytosine deaminase|uniref:hypothetical protein n=1 Tax=Rhodococcus sp. IEGM 1305 TaxID=3047092 RepID=UPI0024B6F32B|nr:hypothetical protein [Rhodococcus sp. IEGM 1305]MDI9949228.1 hypothetical protein [Rhodococcus sp. IEGM 1305]
MAWHVNSLTSSTFRWRHSPQEGLFCRPGAMPLLREALEITGTVVGGCPYAEDSLRDAQRHVDAILDLAVEFEIPADLHLDLANDDSDARFTLAEYVAHHTVARGLEGRVAIGHVTTLAALSPRLEAEYSTLSPP